MTFPRVQGLFNNPRPDHLVVQGVGGPYTVQKVRLRGGRRGRVVERGLAVKVQGRRTRTPVSMFPRIGTGMGRPTVSPSDDSDSSRSQGILS